MWEMTYRGTERIRLDIFVHENLKTMSRAQIQNLIKDKYIQVNNAEKKPNYLLKHADIITGVIPEPSGEVRLASWEHPLEIIHQDKHVIVINKQSGLVVHPGAGNIGNTLVNALLHYFPEIYYVGNPLRPGIVHRLDKETTGLMVIARNQDSYLRLAEQFASRKVQKKYYAIVWGIPQKLSEVITTAIGRDKRDRTKISMHTRKPRTAYTKYTLVESTTYFSLLDVEIKTGRTHQIRVHLALLHHPVVGDETYAGCNWTRIKSAALRESIKRMNLFCLQAYYLGFFHPHNGSWMDFSLPLKDEFRQLISFS
ncbi:MAG: hypothetical protein A2Y62_05580 [Candidatus Fischerbacteria bacterium RBG_13_37_8]|uniref:Pseudouridine synthase n=1 Tax=Candidatus Fischerbacteria bacterium RBG_13_37_8 TaxID=1817863 RepID=A0A1F5VXV3_9BACT|nr:MAG: hypothetical protein A2Y62_05580 [Candidatus Fischerbacteria bacterium RBG_13_37_8]